MWGRDGKYRQQNPQGALRGRRSVLPPADEMAEMIRDGQTAEDIAAAYGVTPTTVDAHLKRGGYHPRTGQPRDQVVEDTPADDTPPPPLVVPGEWVEQALCAQVDPDAWFVDKGGSTQPAKAVCAQCPVRQECLDFALANDEKFGVWGGYSERERRRLRRGQALHNPTKTCADCGGEFTAPRGTRLYCSPTCQDRAKQRRLRQRHTPATRRTA